VAQPSGYLREKHFEKWLAGYACHLARQAVAARVPGPRHLLFAICDHYEPLAGGVSDAVGQSRVRKWVEEYPRLATDFRDADGRAPRYGFFFPGEEYRPEFLDGLAQLASAGYGEVELHLHHEDDTPTQLVQSIETYLRQFAEHGHISRDADGRYRYAFIHGNWCLANARADGRMCGVDNELPLLFETGCYADLTFPAAPDEAQPNRVNQIYWPVGDLARKRAYERGRRACVGEAMWDRLLMITGPLAITRGRARLPIRIESGHLTDHDPPSPERVAGWVNQNIHIDGRPEWLFVKVHTHGAMEDTAGSLLGEGGRTLHRTLTERYNDGQRWILHYVTAREMYNIAMAAMEGRSGSPTEYRDYVVPPPPIAS
jgi:hypothetical protein